jgi:hypothetical protein
MDGAAGRHLQRRLSRNAFLTSLSSSAKTLASQLPNGVSAQEILTAAAAETQYGSSTIASKGNFFGLHGSGYSGQTGTYTTTFGVKTPEFPTSNGFLLSGQLFVNLETPYLSSANGSDPTTFFQTIHAPGYGTTNPSYMGLVLSNKPTDHGVYYFIGACLPKT